MKWGTKKDKYYLELPKKPCENSATPNWWPLHLENREFKIWQLRTTTTVKHATAHDQNHMTVHFTCVVLWLR